MSEYRPSLDRPDLWAREDFREGMFALIEHLKNEPRFTECGRPTAASDAYVQQVKALAKLVRTVL